MLTTLCILCYAIAWPQDWATTSPLTSKTNAKQVVMWTKPKQRLNMPANKRDAEGEKQTQMQITWNVFTKIGENHSYNVWYLAPVSKSEVKHELKLKSWPNSSLNHNSIIWTEKTTTSWVTGESTDYAQLHLNMKYVNSIREDKTSQAAKWPSFDMQDLTDYDGA